MAPQSRGADPPPGPDGARTVAELGARLRALQAWAGVSVRDVHRRVVRLRRARGVPELPALDTVHRCLRPGRTRLDVELVTDVARALLGDDALAAAWRQAHQVVSGRAATAGVVAVRRGLPDPPDGFVGRRAELRLLLEAGTAGVVSVVGMAGVGKTTLAVHAAHQLAGRGAFADGQLSVNLRGHDPEHAPADPLAVLDAMLRQLGCPPHQIATLDLTGRARRLRRLLAGRRALVLLDNAAGEDQVRPLLPDLPGCLVLVTSRRRLTGLPCLHVGLDPFTAAEASDLLGSVVGAARVAGEPDATAGIARAVGHLPLALAVVASRIRATPNWTLRDHLVRLAERTANLAVDRGVAIAIESSYAGQPAPRQRLLRLLAIHPGRSIDARAAAALTGTGLDAARRDLDALAGDSLLVRRAPDRYEMHDLIRVFAADRATDVDAPQARAAALDRLLDYYRYGTYQAARCYQPDYLWTMELARPDPPPPDFPDLAAAAAWLDAERPNLIACALYCAGHDRPSYTADLAVLLQHHLHMTGQLPDGELLDRAVSRVCTGVDRARALGRLGSVCNWLGRLEEASEHYRQALAEFRLHPHPDYEARCLANYAVLCRRLGRFTEALDGHRRALATFRGQGNEALAAHQLVDIGYAEIVTGRYDHGIDSLRQGLAAARSCRNPVAEAGALTNLAFAASVAGRPAEALDLHQKGLRILREIGHRAGQAMAHNGIGAALTALGRPAAALTEHRHALVIARQTGDREVEAETLAEVGAAVHRLGRLDDAMRWQASALRVAERSGNPWQQAQAHEGMAAVLADRGDLHLARTHLRQALTGHTAMATADAGRVTARLAALGAPGAGVFADAAGVARAERDAPAAPEVGAG